MKKSYGNRRPERKCFILEGIFNPLLPFALIWFLVDAFFIGAFIYGAHHGEAEEIASFTPIMIFFL